MFQKGLVKKNSSINILTELRVSNSPKKTTDAERVQASKDSVQAHTATIQDKNLSAGYMAN